MNSRLARRGFTLIELLVVIIVLGALVAILMPALSKARKSAISAKLRTDWSYGAGREMAADNIVHAQLSSPPPLGGPVPHGLARVSSFDATIALTPRLSVGTPEPESIYEAKFNAKLDAVQPKGQAEDCEIELPLPPEIISLTDLSVTADKVPSETVTLRDQKLVWRGHLKPEPTKLEINYTAVGRGLYALEIPPGGIVESFNIVLTAHGSDVRMLELSLQPTTVDRAGRRDNVHLGLQAAHVWPPDQP